jgi:hypothetical protein
MADPESHAAASASYRPIVRSLAWDIVLNATIPAACYHLSKWFISPSELIALVIATIFPVLKSIYDVAKRREVDPVAVVVLLGIVTGILALFFGGDPRMLLIRESFFTGAFGIACLVSLLFPRPIMFYFGRYFMAGRDPQKRAAFDARWQNPVVRRAHRLIATVWGLVFIGEFVTRVIMVYNFSVPVVLSVSPILLGLATIVTIVWTLRFAYKTRERVAGS